MDLKDIQNLIKFVTKSGANEVKLEMEDVKITIKTGSGKTETTIGFDYTSIHQPASRIDLFQMCTEYSNPCK